MLNERKLFFQLVRDHIPDGKRLKFIAKHGPDSVAEPMRALYNAIQSAKLPNGMMIVSECGRDCDGVVYSGKTRECVATLAGFYALYDETAEWADGPFNLYPVPVGETVEYHSRDAMLEAFENGHAHCLHV